MKNIMLAAATATIFAATQSAGGSLADPILDQDLIVAETTSSSSGSALVGVLAIIMSIPVMN